MTPIRKAVLILLCLAGFVAVSAARSQPRIAPEMSGFLTTSG